MIKQLNIFLLLIFYIFIACNLINAGDKINIQILDVQIKQEVKNFEDNGSRFDFTEDKFISELKSLFADAKFSEFFNVFDDLNIELQNNAYPDLLLFTEIENITQTTEKRGIFVYFYTTMFVRFEILDINADFKTIYQNSVKRVYLDKCYKNNRGGWQNYTEIDEKITKLYSAAVNKFSADFYDFVFPLQPIIEYDRKANNYKARINANPFFLQSGNGIAIIETKKIDSKKTVEQTIANGIIDKINQDNFEFKISEAKIRINENMFVRIIKNSAKNTDKIVFDYRDYKISSVPEITPDWIYDVPINHDYYNGVAVSDLFTEEKDARDAAFKIAFIDFAKYCGTKVFEIHTEEISINSQADNIKNAEIKQSTVSKMVTDAFVRGVKAARWYIENYNRVYSDKKRKQKHIIKRICSMKYRKRMSNLRKKKI